MTDKKQMRKSVGKQTGDRRKNASSRSGRSAQRAVSSRTTSRKRKTNREKLRVCILLEFLVIIVLSVTAVCKFGLGDEIAKRMSFGKPTVQELDLSGINSSTAVLMEARSGEVIGELNGEQQMYPASMTKIMTAILSIENLDNLDQEITITNDMVADLYVQDAMQAGFQPNETVRAIDLLYGVMLPSGAECCVALADTVAGSVSDFVTLMNEKAEKLGMTGTHFSSISGLHREDHYSTARDIALLLRYAIKNSTFRKIIESPYYSTPGTNIHPEGITFYSTMFKNLSDPSVTGGEILGGKTGYTNVAGHCLASFAEIDGMEYILVTGGAAGTGISHINDAVTIYNRLGEAALALNSN